MRRALLTGSAGFLGSHLTEALIAQGWHVAGIDNLATGAEAHHVGLPPKQFTFQRASVGTAKLDYSGCDVVFHLAASIGVAHIAEDPLAMMIEHAEDVHRMARFAMQSGAVFVLASTSEVYGARHLLSWNAKQQRQPPATETDYCAIGPSDQWRWGYAVSKLQAEHVALGYARQHGLRVVIPRLFNVAGPRQRADTGMVVPRFVTAALKGEALRVHGDGQHRRAFAHVEDVVATLMQLAECEAAYGQVVNVGSTVSMPILQAATNIRSYVANHYRIMAPIEHVNFDKLDTGAAQEAMRVREADTSKLHKLLGHGIPHRWGDIVRDVCGYWANRLEKPKEVA